MIDGDWAPACPGLTVRQTSIALAKRELMGTRWANNWTRAFFMTDRYGDFVLYRPPVSERTALLWFGPGVLLVLGLASLIFILRRRSRLGAEAFDPDEADDPARTP